MILAIRIGLGLALALILGFLMFGGERLASRVDAAGPLPIKLERHLAVPMRDGVTLYGDLYRPRADGKYPVLIVRTPYGVQRDGVHETMMKFAQNGYATFIQDTRGRYESEGKWEPFRTEAEDGYDTIEWAAKQPWSNGKVATQGGSYLGHVQWRAGSLTPPSLVAMFPAVASTNIYANWITLGGAYRLSFNYGWGVANRVEVRDDPQSPAVDRRRPRERWWSGSTLSGLALPPRLRPILALDQRRGAVCQRQSARLHQWGMVRHLRARHDQRLCWDEEVRGHGEGAA